MSDAAPTNTAVAPETSSAAPETASQAWDADAHWKSWNINEPADPDEPSYPDFNSEDPKASYEAQKKFFESSRSREEILKKNAETRKYQERTRSLLRDGVPLVPDDPDLHFKISKAEQAEKVRQFYRENQQIGPDHMFILANLPDIIKQAVEVGTRRSANPQQPRAQAGAAQEKKVVIPTTTAAKKVGADKNDIASILQRDYGIGEDSIRRDPGTLLRPPNK